MSVTWVWELVTACNVLNSTGTKESIAYASLYTKHKAELRMYSVAAPASFLVDTHEHVCCACTITEAKLLITGHPGSG